MIEAALDAYRGDVETYNAVVMEARDFAGEIASEARGGAVSGRSEQWRASAKGQAAEAFHLAWAEFSADDHPEPSSEDLDEIGDDVGALLGALPEES